MINIKYPAKSPLRELADALPRKYRKAFREQIASEAIPAIQDALFKDLVNFTPPARTKSSPKFIWSRNRAANNRARRWWFAAVADGRVNTNGSNYVRSGKLQKQWRVYGNVTTDSAIIQVINRAKGAKYVYGNRERPQIPGHRVTGWPSVNRQLAGKQRTLDAAIRRIANKIVDDLNKS